MEAVSLIMQFLFSAGSAVFSVFFSNLYTAALVLFPIVAYIFVMVFTSLQKSGTAKKKE